MVGEVPDGSVAPTVLSTRAGLNPEQSATHGLGLGSKAPGVGLGTLGGDPRAERAPESTAGRGWRETSQKGTLACHTEGVTHRGPWSRP